MWAEAGGPDDPPGGKSETIGQPRLRLDVAVEPQIWPAGQFLLGEPVFGVCEQLMHGEPVVPSMQMTCNPIVRRGHTDWHCDSNSVTELGDVRSRTT